MSQLCQKVSVTNGSTAVLGVYDIGITGASGTFTVGETVNFATSGAAGTVVSWTAGVNATLEVTVSGSAQPVSEETVTGASSGAAGTTGVIADLDFRTDVRVGDLFHVLDTSAVYVVGSVDTKSKVSLTQTYVGAGATTTGLFSRSFTTNLKLPYPELGDKDHETVVKRLALKLDDLVSGARTVTIGKDSKAYEWAIQHDLDTTSVMAVAYDEHDRLLTPDTLDVSNPSIAFFYFSNPVQGRALVSAGTPGNADGATYAKGGFYGFEWVVDHGLQSRDVGWFIYDDREMVVFPDEVSVNTANQMSFYFDVPTEGRVVITTGAGKQVDAERIGRVQTSDATPFRQVSQLNFNDDLFYLSTDADGNPVVNLEHIDVDESGTTDFVSELNFREAVTTEKAAHGLQLDLDGDTKTVTLDFTSGNDFFVALKRNTILSASNVPSTPTIQNVNIVTEQPSDGFYNITWGGDFLWPKSQLGSRGGPNATQAPQSIDLFSGLVVHTDGQGTKILGAASSNFY